MDSADRTHFARSSSQIPESDQIDRHRQVQPTSGLVRRLVDARDDPARQRIRAWLGAISDTKLLEFGLSASDIAVLRSAARRRSRP